MAFITLVQKINAATMKFGHCLLLTNDVYALIFTINCGLTHMWQLFKVWHLTM